MAVESRKRKTPHTETDEEAARAVFRKHFETQFAPLPEPVKPPEHSSDDQEDSDGEGEGEGGEGEEWGGISDGDEDDEEAVEVVDHTSKASDAALMGKRELKAFMSSRPPSHDPKPKAALPAPTSSHPEDSRTLLSQDLELHRLITESHLLDPSSKLHSKSFAEGRVRARTTDHRITSLAPGAASIHRQKSMPMAMRKGIESAKVSRETQRRKEAAENGIVLERKGGNSRGKRKRGSASVDMPGVGRMRGAELSLSEGDIRSIESGGGGFRGGRGGSRGRGVSSRGKRR